MSFDGTHLLTLINPGEYNEKECRDISGTAKAHLKAGGFVLCEYEMMDNLSNDALSKRN